MAMPLLAPKREEMRLNRTPVTVEYLTDANAEQLEMPLYPEADVEDSFAYAVTTREGSRVVAYAEAALLSRDSIEKVIAYYREQLPGHPEPELIDDETGKRHVLAVANDEEVRQVTVAEHEGGARVRLVRSTRPAVPRAPVRPSGPHQRAI
jgi:hypothetical protein